MSQMQNQNSSTANRERVAKAIRLANMNSQQRREYVLREKIRAGTDHYDTLVNGPNSGYPQNVGRFDNAAAMPTPRDMELRGYIWLDLEFVSKHIETWRGKTISGDPTIHNQAVQRLGKADRLIEHLEDPSLRQKWRTIYNGLKRDLDNIR